MQQRDSVPRLPESELDIMLAIWDAEEIPVGRVYFEKSLSHKKWSVNALNSFLTRLEDKGFLQSNREGKSKYYSPLVARESYLSQESKSILQKLYRGSLKNFILSMSGQEQLSNGEIEELKQYLDNLGKEGK